MGQEPERRRGRRVAVEARPASKVRATLDARLLDMSSTGAKIEHYNLLRPGFACTLELPPGLARLTLSAQVVRSVIVGSDTNAAGERLLRYESGLAFRDVSVEQQRVLADLMRQLSPEDGLGEGRVVL